MNSVELYETLRSAAEREFAAGRKSKQIFAEADEMETSGFSVSAPYHRLLGQLLKELENASIQAD
jgi:hypothetical protein